MSSRLHYTIRGNIQNIYRSVKEIPRAYRLCRKYLTNTNTYYVVINDHIGDFIITMGYLSSYKKLKNIPHLTVCITEKYIDLITLFPDAYDAVVSLQKEALEEIVTLDSTKQGEWYLKALGNVDIINPANPFTNNDFDYIAQFPKLTLHDCIKYGEMKLGIEAEYQPPFVENNNIRSERKKVLLVNDSRTIKGLSDKFYEKLYDYVTKGMGYDAVFNENIRMDLSELFNKVNDSILIIGERNGLMDLLSYAGCTIVALYPGNDWRRSFFDLDMLEKKKANVKQLVINEADGIDKQIKTIAEVV